MTDKQAFAIEATLCILGLALVWIETSWMCALGFFIFAWGNNVAQSHRHKRDANR